MAGDGVLWQARGYAMKPSQDMPVTAVRRKYDYIARLYDILELPIEYGRHRAIRRRVFEGLSGTVLDAGVGTGRNMPFYPADARVVGIDFSPAMLGQAARRRERLGVEVELLEMDVLRTTFPDRHFDAIVATFLFCVLDDTRQLPALKELARICRPAGSIHLLDYAYPGEDPSRSAILRLWAPYVRWVFGAAFDRDTERYLPAAGLEMVERHLFARDIIRLVVARPKTDGG